MRQYKITGMSCAACQARVEKAVNAIEQVTACNVSLLTNSMGVEGDVDPSIVIKAVEAAGYGASLKESEEIVDTESPKLMKRLLTSLGFLLLLMYVSMGHNMWGFPIPLVEDYPVVIAIIQMILTIIIMVINRKFFINGFKGLLHRNPNMDTLVALGSFASFGWSVYILVRMAMDGDNRLGQLYFESAAMILVLITVGKYLEARSKGKTSNALKSLLDLSPKIALIEVDGKQQEVDITQVEIGDIFVVKAGTSIPVDGEIIEGQSAVDESALTGESIPVDKQPGEFVSAGTMNQYGFLRCKATRVGEDTTLAKIIQMVSDAAATKAPIAKVADKVSGIFVPVVMSIALLTIVVWLLLGEEAGFALARGISVLVISCPCALGLATPVAIMVGNGVGAKNGLLFKNATALEITGKSRIVVLDKTGTVTNGKPKVVDVILPDGVQEKELLDYAVALEQKSEHPLSKAITEYYEDHFSSDNTLKLSSFEVLPGHGLKGILDGNELVGGSLAYIQGLVDIPAAIVTQAEELANQGKTNLAFVYDRKFLGIFAVADTIKEDSKQAIQALENMGIFTVMLTGDNEKTAKHVANQAGISHVIAEVLPDDKEYVVRSLKSKSMVAMVGDGINDAPALTRADVGIAIGAGADVAVDAADVVLVKNSLMDVVSAIGLSKKTLKNIYENLFWAFIYNVIGIPLAAGVYIHLFGWELSPMFGAAAMSLSSFCVVTNALRLNLLKLPLVSKRRLQGLNIDELIIKINDELQEEKGEDNTMKMKMKINGMMCGHCEARVKQTLEAIEGVKEAKVSHEKGSAVVSLEKEIAGEILAKAVTDAGYEVVEVKG